MPSRLSRTALGLLLTSAVLVAQAQTPTGHRASFATDLPSIAATIVTTGTVASLATPQDPLPAQSPPTEKQPRSVFRSGVEIVDVSVTVTDKNGRSVTDLTQGDFVIAEDGIAQQIVSFQSMQAAAPVPIGLGLVVDLSGSMGAQAGAPNSMAVVERLTRLKTVVERLIRERLRREDEVYILAFGSNTRLVQSWTSDHERVVKTVRRLAAGDLGERTALYDAIGAAVPVSSSGRRKKQVMLVITDGNDTVSKTTRAKVAEAARASRAVVYALLLPGERYVRSGGTRSTPVAELSQITDPTGGFTRPVADFQELEDAILKLGTEFTQQYEVGYARLKADGGYHEIAVRVRRPGVTARHRQGYVAN